MAQRVAEHGVINRSTSISGAAVRRKEQLSNNDHEEPELSEPVEGETATPERESSEKPAVTEPTTTCDDCGGRLVTESSETYCSECGLVQNDARLNRSEKRNFDKEDGDARRCGGTARTVTRHDNGMVTKIGHSGDLRQLSARKRRQIQRFQEHQTRSRFGSTDYRRSAAFTEIKRITATLGLPSTVTEQACVLFRKCHDENLLKGRTSEWFTAASVYAVCRCSDLVRTVDEIAEYARCEPANIRLAYTQINAGLGLGAPPTSPQEYIPRFASKLDVSYETRAMAEELAAAVHESGIDTGRSPSGMAGACIYRAAKQAGDSITQSAAGEVVGVTAGTIRKSKDLLDEIDNSDGPTRAGGKTSEAVQTFGAEGALSGLESTTTSSEPAAVTEAREAREREERPGHLAPIAPGSMPDSSESALGTTQADAGSDTDHSPEPAIEAVSESEPETDNQSSINHEPSPTLELDEPNARGTDTAWRPSIQLCLPGVFETPPAHRRASLIMDSSDPSNTNRSAEETTQQSLNDSLTAASAESSASTGSQSHSGSASGSEPDSHTTTVSEQTMDDNQLPSPLGNGEITIDDESVESKHVIKLHSKRRRRSDRPDSFRFWARIPDALVESGDFPLPAAKGDEVNSQVQITFTDGEFLDSGEDMETLDRDIITGVPGIYLRRVREDEDASDLKWVRKLSRDDLGYPITLPPKLITEATGLGLGAEEFHEGPDLYFEAIVRGDSLVLVPAGYDDGSVYERPPLPVEEWRTEDGGIKDLSDIPSQSLPGGLVPLSQQRNRTSDDGPDSFLYSVYLRELLTGDDCEIEAGDYVQIDYDDGRDPANLTEMEAFSRYDDSFNPAIFISKVENGEHMANDPGTRKIRSMRDGAPVSIPPRYVNGPGSLGIDSQYYDSGENPLLLEPLVEGEVLMLTPVGYKDGTPYPIPLPEPDEKETEGELGYERYLDETGIRTDVAREAASQTDVSTDLIAAGLRAIDGLDPDELAAEGLLRDDFSTVSLTADGTATTAEDAFVRIEFIDLDQLDGFLRTLVSQADDLDEGAVDVPATTEPFVEAISKTLNAELPAHDEEVSEERIEQLREERIEQLIGILPQIHARQAQYYMGTDVSPKQRRFASECAALVFRDETTE